MPAWNGLVCSKKRSRTLCLAAIALQLRPCRDSEIERMAGGAKKRSPRDGGLKFKHIRRGAEWRGKERPEHTHFGVVAAKVITDQKLKACVTLVQRPPFTTARNEEFAPCRMFGPKLT